MEKLERKIFNSLVAAACGDALGAVTEQRSTECIKERFGGYVTELISPPDDNLAHGMPAGTVTDDFSIAYYSAEDWLKHDSRPTRELSKETLVRWFDHPEYTRFIGPTTKKAILAFKDEEMEADSTNILDVINDRLLCKNEKVTNGAAMKAGIVGLINPGNVDRAIDEAITYCIPTHDNWISLAGGCAIAAATAKALEDGATYEEVLEAGLYGAREGYERAKKVAQPAAGANVEKKSRLAIEIGTKYQDDFDMAMKETSEIIGGGLMAYEAVPAAFGHIAACKGRIKDSVLMGVNGGDDTDTVACMTGFIVGALSNSDNFPDEYIDKINEVNHFDLRKMAADLYRFNLKEAK